MKSNTENPNLLQAKTKSDSYDILSTESHLVQKKPLFVSNKQDNTIFPDDLSTLQFVRHIGGGSGGVYILQDDQGDQYTFKAHHDLNHLHGGWATQDDVPGVKHLS
jgi:hypothetical protein